MVNLKKFEIIQIKVVSHTEWQRPKLIFLTFSANEEQKKCFVVHIDFKLWCFREQYTWVFFLNMSHIVELCWFRKDPHRMCRFCARYSWVSVLGSLTILVAIV